MTGDQLAARLAELGLDPIDIPARQQLFTSVLTTFAQVTGRAPDHAWWVPGRLEVFGKHTDYGGGHSLVGTVPRGFLFAARRRDDGVIRMLDARRDDRLTILPGQRHLSFKGWRHYAEVVVRRLAANFPGAALGADIVFAGDLTTASGMSSSSALVVGLAATLSRVAELDQRAEWRAEIRTPSDVAGYYACLENGLSFGGLRGDSGVGTHGGSEDHVGIVCSEAGSLTAWTFVPIRAVSTVRIPDEWRFVIMSSGIAARKTGEAQGAYNRLSSDARLLLRIWNESTASANASLREVLASGPSVLERLTEVITAWTGDDPDADALLRRLAHFIREDGRVMEAVEAFRTADRDRLTTLADQSQADAERLLRNQVPETIALSRDARGLGAFAANAFGAGFGGSVWALVEQSGAEAFAREWIGGYLGRYPSNTGASVFVAQPGPALTQVF